MNDTPFFKTERYVPSPPKNANDGRDERPPASRMRRWRSGLPIVIQPTCDTSPPGIGGFIGTARIDEFDDTLHAFDRARAICRQAAAECDKLTLATAIASAKTVAAIDRLSRADRRIAATVDQWDCDPWLLNTPAGIVDLRTGNAYRHRAEDYMTKITAVAPAR